LTSIHEKLTGERVQVTDQQYIFLMFLCIFLLVRQVFSAH